MTVIDEIRNQVLTILVNDLCVDEALIVTNATFDQLKLDYLDQIELVMFAEKVFDIDIPDADMDHVTTVEQFCSLIARM